MPQRWVLSAGSRRPVIFGLPTGPDFRRPWPSAPGLNWGHRVSVSLPTAAVSRRPFLPQVVAQRQVGGCEAAGRRLGEGQDFPLLFGDLRAGSQVMGQFGYIPSTVTDPFCPHPIPPQPSPSPRRQDEETVFLSSPSLSFPFLFLKKIAFRQRGPSCGGLWPPSALSKALLVLRTPFPGRREPPGKF